MKLLISIILAVLVAAIAGHYAAELMHHATSALSGL